MRKLKFYFTFLALSVLVPVFAQVQVDKPIELTGLNNNDRLIKNVGIAQDTADAVSAAAVQNGYLIYSTASGNINTYAINISPAPAAYVAGMSFNFVANQTNSGAATLNVNGLGAIPIVKNVNQPLNSCEIQQGLIVTVVYDGTNFQMTSSVSTGALPTTAIAGPDQLGVSGTITLAANTPTNGTGSWTILSGTGGSITDPTSPASTFTGLPGNSYVLSWTIAGCSTSNSSNVDIVYYAPGSQTFNYISAVQSFTVPAGVTSVNVKLWGAGGGGANGGGPYFGFAGGGAFLNGTLTVSPNQVLSIIVGQGGDYTRAAPYGGGGAGTANMAGSGGGRSAIIIGGNDILTAGGGGGSGNAYSGYWRANGGGGGATTGANGTEGQDGSCVGVEGGQGGTTSTGGAGGVSCNSSGYGGTMGNQYTGGSGGTTGTSFSGGGGGGGYYGGGGGGSYYGGGGGGGSSYYTNVGFTLTSNIAGSTTPQASAPWSFSPAGGNTDPDYQPGIGNGGYYASGLPSPTVGGNGLIIISW